MFFNLLLDRILAVKLDACKGGKSSKELLTVLFCCNMDGSEKLNPLTIGKSKNLHAFNGHMTLLCQYDINKKDRITTGMFTSAVLFIYNCHDHPQILNMKNIKLVLLPPNITSTLQPLDHGIIKALKANFV
ncbi:hypothetical protein PR048_023410 [Dryococelus australis]|uniref:DDE-1 domain-containing protein n=1 Tax=Dryococelus australis TaxID=614101 RepID=A0ABQ9GU01_9NEOP|nr:hypothetical protein PR048_023410 [Dryococelus australis]